MLTKTNTPVRLPPGRLKLSTTAWLCVRHRRARRVDRLRQCRCGPLSTEFAPAARRRLWPSAV